MNVKHLVAAAAATALLGGAAYAQQPTTPEGGAQPGSVTGDWNGAHAPSDDKQYKESTTVTTTVPSTATTTHSGHVDSTVSSSTSATAATSVGTPAATVTTQLVTNGPVPDTPENRRKYGQPLSRAGKMTAPAGN